MPCISIALYNCVEHPLPPVICCPNVFLPYGWDLPSSSLPPHLHTHSSLPASRFCCPSCTAVITKQEVVSCNVLRSLNLPRSKVFTPPLPISYWRLFPCACALCPTQDNFEGVAGGKVGPLPWSRFSSFK